MSTMKAPIQNLVYTLDAIPTKLVRTLQAVADQKGEA
jgi:large subunit ribosomal protein L10